MEAEIDAKVAAINARFRRARGLAGAAQELGEAVIINPYDIDGFAAAIAQAIEMDASERRRRMREPRRVVAGRNVFARASDILNGLQAFAPAGSAASPANRGAARARFD